MFNHDHIMSSFILQKTVITKYFVNLKNGFL